MPLPDVLTNGVDNPPPPNWPERVIELLETTRPKVSDVLSLFAPSRLHVILKPFMPDLALSRPEDNLEQFEKLAEAGIAISPDGTIDLTAAGSNRFNVTLFRMQDGTFQSGADFLRRQRDGSVFEFFRRRCVDPTKLCAPHRVHDLTKKQYIKRPELGQFRPKRNGEFTPDEVLAAARALPNLDRMAELFDLHAEEDHWVASLQQRPFVSAWFLMNGGACKGGVKVKRLCGIAESNKDGAAQFFRLVFGDSIRLIMPVARSGCVALRDRYTRSFIIEELQKPENLEIFFAHGVHLEDDKCHVTTSITTFRRKVSLLIDGRSVLGVTLLKSLGLGIGQKDLKKLLQWVFPKHLILLWRERNGRNMEKESDDVTIGKLREPANMDTLRRHATALPDGRLLVDLAAASFQKSRFALGDRALSIYAVLDRLELMHGKSDIQNLYRMVFGEDKIVTVLAAMAG